jgi:hypothetical protein
MNSGKHKYQVLNVSGIDGGKIMCETRSENQETREPREFHEPRETREPRESNDWTKVNKRVSEGRGGGRESSRGGSGRGRGGRDRGKQREEVSISADL